MAKEVIYIDVKDDVVSISTKINQSPEKIIALVPPKQTGVLQSAVNLQLLVKMAKQAGKVLVLITNQEALIKLAAVAQIPVAKSLTSKPEMPEIPALKVDGEDDIIDGTKIGIGELAGLPADAPAPVVTKDQPKSTDSDEKPALSAPKVKIPNYNKFRNRLLIGFGLAAILISFLVWAIWFAPQAEIAFTTTTKTVNVSSSVSLVKQPDAIKIEENILHAQTHHLSKKRSLEIAVTGEKELKVPASGTVTFKNYNIAPVSVAAGTQFKTGSCKFVAKETVTVPGASGSVLNYVLGTAQVRVEATQPGPACNIPAKELENSLSNIKSHGSEMTGGSERKIKVMTQEDFDKAKEQLAKETHDSATKELRNKFDSSMVIVDESLVIKEAEMTQTSKVDEEAKDGKVKFEQAIDYQISGLSRKLLEQYISHVVLRDDASAHKARVYDAGLGQLHFSDFVTNAEKTSMRIVTQAQIGPNIDKDQVKQFVKGKQFGEISSHYEAIDGVREVSVKLSPFWVSTVPTQDDKIVISIRK